MQQRGQSHWFPALPLPSKRQKMSQEWCPAGWVYQKTQSLWTSLESHTHKKNFLAYKMCFVDVQELSYQTKPKLAGVKGFYLQIWSWSINRVFDFTPRPWIRIVCLEEKRDRLEAHYLYMHTIMCEKCTNLIHLMQYSYTGEQKNSTKMTEGGPFRCFSLALA